MIAARMNHSQITTCKRKASQCSIFTISARPDIHARSAKAIIFNIVIGNICT